MELEGAGALVVDRDTGHVRGQHVGGELDPMPRHPEGVGHRASQRGLAHARHVVEEQVALGQQAGHGQVDDLALAADEAGHRVRDSLQGRPRVCYGLVTGRG